jgi:Domain of unknown function (DUF5666)
MRTRITISTIGAAAALGATGVAAMGAVASSAAVNAPSRHLEGRIIAVNRPARTFTVRDAQRGTLTVSVTPSTRFERIAGFSALHNSELVDVHATGTGGSWRANLVEPAGGAGARSGAGDRGNHLQPGDDRGNHLEPGDDRSR